MLLLLLILLLFSCFSYSYRSIIKNNYHYHKYNSNKKLCNSNIFDDGDDNNNDREISKLLEEASRITVTNNMTATLINLIEYGDNYVVNNSDYNNSDANSIKATSFLPTHSTWTKVSGCMADVRMKVSIDKSNQLKPVFIDSVADSRVARGMAAVLCIGLKETSANNILNLIPSEIIKSNKSLVCFVFAVKVSSENQIILSPYLVTNFLISYKIFFGLLTAALPPVITFDAQYVHL
jgi:hypothetical protein